MDILRRFLETHHAERHDHGDERQAVDEETTREPEELETEASEHRTDNARELKLRRVERDGVCQIFASYQIESHRLIRWAGDRHTAAGHKRKSQDQPFVRVVCPNQSC